MLHPLFRPLAYTLPIAGGLLAATITANATDAGTNGQTQLDTVVVSSAGQNSVYDVAQPVTVLDKNAVNANPGATLGTLLEGTPGISNASFGPGVGRPVLRGMSGSRVKILQNGSNSADLSAMSSDHSPMAEATSAEQIEIVHGPATLLYGGGAIGGVVNLIDRRIHEQPLTGVHGQVGSTISTVDNGHNLNALLDSGQGNWVLHLDGFQRSAGDYSSGSGNSSAGQNQGRIANSDSKGQGGALALSWADGKQGFAGITLSTLEYDYGVPNTDGTDFRVKPSQTRLDIKGGWRPHSDGLFGWIEEWRSELSVNDYQHDETDGALVVGLFDQQTTELQSRIRHQNFGRWSGSIGIQVQQQKLALCHNHAGCSSIPAYPQLSWDGSMGPNFTALNSSDGTLLFAHDTPMPITTSLDSGVFIVEQRDWQHGTLELGARLDIRTIEADPDLIRPASRREQSYYDDKTFRPLTLSAAGTWVLAEEQRLALSLARVQRAPDAAELYWNGDHHATFSFQLDNPDLTVETAHSIDLNWLYAGRDNQLRVALYHYRFRDYIYNDLKSIRDPFHGDAVYRHEQADARFSGGEFSWQHSLSQRWSVELGADAVHARLTSGADLPRTPPTSLLLALSWQHQNGQHQGWAAWVESRTVASQKRTAANEDPSDGYTLLNASLTYHQPLAYSKLLWRLAASNLTDQYALNHVSYLKHAAPLAGRNVQLGLNWSF